MYFLSTAAEYTSIASSLFNKLVAIANVIGLSTWCLSKIMALFVISGPRIPSGIFFICDSVILFINLKVYQVIFKVSRGIRVDNPHFEYYTLANGILANGERGKAVALRIFHKRAGKEIS